MRMHERFRTNSGEFGRNRSNLSRGTCQEASWAKPVKNGQKMGIFRQKRGKTGEIGRNREKMGRNGQKTGKQNRNLAKQGKTKSFAETLFGFGHPWFIPLKLQTNQLLQECK